MIIPSTYNHSSATAFLLHHHVLYFTCLAQHPVGSLIEGIWIQYSDQARAITRNRVYSYQPLTPLCGGMLKVAGKRSSVLSALEFDQQLCELNFNEKIEITHHSSFISSSIPIPTEPVTHEYALMVAKQLAAYSKLGIAAVLLDEQKKIVSSGWNDHSINKTMHAEIMLVKNFFSQYQKKIPPNYTLVTTLQPCAMCAGYLHAFCDDFNSLKVIYEKADLGPFAQNSILVPGSPLWTRFQNQRTLD